MIIFGSLEAYRHCVNNELFTIDTVINFNTTLQIQNQMRFLNPYNCGAYQFNANTPEFDQWFVNYVSFDPNAFKEFIDIVRIAYNGQTVWILTDFSTEVGINVMECIIKFILEQYGYESCVVRTIEDIDFVKEGDFSDIGLMNFDAAMENYVKNFGPILESKE